MILCYKMLQIENQHVYLQNFHFQYGKIQQLRIPFRGCPGPSPPHNPTYSFDIPPSPPSLDYVILEQIMPTLFTIFVYFRTKNLPRKHGYHKRCGLSQTRFCLNYCHIDPIALLEHFRALKHAILEHFSQISLKISEIGITFFWTA